MNIPALFRYVWPGRAESRADSLHPRDPALVKWFGGTPGFSGIHVDADIALTWSAVYSAVRLLAETIATLPLQLYRFQADGGREIDRAHNLYDKLHWQPNSSQTAVEFWEMMAGHTVLRGRAYAVIARNNAGRVESLTPLHPDHVEVIEFQSGRFAFKWTPLNGPPVTYLEHEVLRLKGPFGGASPIEFASEAVGLALALERHGSAFFGNNASPGGVLKYPGRLKSEAKDNLRRSWEEMHRGSGAAGRMAVLEDGLEWQQIGIAAKDAQFLEGRKFQVTEVARIFRVPPHMIGDMEAATFSNIEQQALEFVVHSLRPWLVRFEQCIRRDLFSPAMRKTHFTKFVVEGLLRGDIKARAEALAIQRNAGVLSANEWRAIEDRNPVEDGDTFLMPMNMGETGDTAPPPAAGEDDAASRARVLEVVTASYRDLLADAMRRTLRREGQLVAKRVGGDLEGIGDIYAQHEPAIIRAVVPVLEAYARAACAMSGRIHDTSGLATAFGYDLARRRCGEAMATWTTVWAGDEAGRVASVSMAVGTLEDELPARWAADELARFGAIVAGDLITDNREGAA